jgi:hypothetical protein
METLAQVVRSYASLGGDAFWHQKDYEVGRQLYRLF